MDKVRQDIPNREASSTWHQLLRSLDGAGIQKQLPRGQPKGGWAILPSRKSQPLRILRSCHRF